MAQATRRGATVLILILAAALAGGGARAQDLLLLGEAPRIRAITIEGNVHFDDGTIAAQMSSRAPSWRRPFRTARLTRGQLEQDVGAIEGFYRDRGYLRARVAASVIDRPDGIEIRLDVDEGKPVLLSDTDIRGLSERPRASLLKSLKNQPGRPLSPYQLEQDRLTIEGHLADRGRPYGQVEDNVQFAGDSAVAVFLVNEGPLVTIGDVNFSGADGIDTVRLARELTVHPGSRFSRKELTRTRQRLYDTGLFLDVSPRFPAVPDTVVDVSFDLRRRKEHWFGAGVGFSNTVENLIRFSGEWGTRNVLGSGRRFSASGRLAHYFLADTTLNRRFFDVGEASIDAAVYEPWLFGTRVRGRLAGFYRLDDNVRNSNIRQTSYGSTAEISRELKERRTNLALQFEARWVRNNVERAVADVDCEEDPLLCRERYRTRLASLRFSYDDRDLFLNPTRGSRHDLLLQNAGGILGGDNNFQKTVAASSFHTRIGSGATLSTRLRVGSINPPGEVIVGGVTVPDVDAVPVEDRFFSGGATSVRGYEENNLDGLAVTEESTVGGGLFELVANAELRFGIRGPLGGVLFLDAGNVWRDFDGVRFRHLLPTFDAGKTELEHLRYSVGGGIRFNTPVGPVRVEGAYRLSPMATVVGGRPAEHLRDIHFALGHTF